MNATAEAKLEKAADMKDQEEKPPRPKRGRPKPTAPGGGKGSQEARRTAAAVLEVLAGARTPTEAAEALAVSANRYYQMEARALHGLIEACEPRAKGRTASPEKQLAGLRLEVDKLRNESARFQALARASQKTVGLAAPKPSGSKKGGKGRRRRKPVVRALKMAKALSPAPPVAGPPAAAVSG
jgi:hypothetical protein